MHQATMFHDSIFDALGCAVQAAGGFKRVAHALWPTLLSEIGTTRLRSCLNPEHSQKLDLAEVLAIARMARDLGDHSVMQFLGQALGYEVAPVTREQLLTDVDTEIRNTLAALQTQMARRERVLKAV